MSSFVRCSTAFRRIPVRIALAVALAALLAPGLDALDFAAARIAELAVDRGSSLSEAPGIETSREVGGVRYAPASSPDGEQADPQCNGWEERAEVDDVDARRRCGWVDSAVLTSKAAKVLTEESMCARAENQRCERPPSLRA